jgi:hypothetical protein
MFKSGGRKGIYPLVRENMHYFVCEPTFFYTVRRVTICAYVITSESAPRMSPAAISSIAYSFYMMPFGLALLVIPNMLLGLFGFPPTDEVWIRVLGLLTFCTGYLYLYCGIKEQTWFFRATISERLIFFVGMILIVVLANANPLLILIGSVDLIGALWTFWALRRD